MRYTTTMNQEMKRRVTACAAGFSLPRYRELSAKREALAALEESIRAIREKQSNQDKRRKQQAAELWRLLFPVNVK